MKIEVNNEILDEIVSQYILEAISDVYSSRAILMNKGRLLRDFEVDDLADHTKTLEGLTVVFKYINVKSDWYKLNKYIL